MDESTDKNGNSSENNLTEDNELDVNQDCSLSEEKEADLLADTNETVDSSGSGEVSESETELTKCDNEPNNIPEVEYDATNFNQLEVGEDDRSQTPLQDEIDNMPCVENENMSVKSTNEEEEYDMSKGDAPQQSPLAGDTALNDDHGELDYEEDEMMEDGQDKLKNDGEFIDPEKKSEEAKPDCKGSDGLSSDGELADDDECEEGEIKEPGTKKPFVRPLCRFFTRGNCTWGINCRFLHPGINDKGNYSLIDQQHPFQPMPPPGMVPILRGPPPTWVHERLGKRMLPPPRPSEHVETEMGGMAASSTANDTLASESAWERGLRHAKEIQRKRKDTDGDDKKEKEDSASPPGSPSVGAGVPSQLGPPPPRDPYYDDIHRPLPPPMPGRIPIPMPLPPPMHHPPDAWSYRHPFEYDMRWHRPPPPEFMHHGFPPMHDMRFMDRERMPGGRRFSPPLRMDSTARKDERMSKYDRYRTADGQGVMETARGKCEEWKDPWLRTKSPKKKHDSSSRSRSRSRKRSRSKRSYSSFSSSSYSSKSRSSSSFSSYSSSRSSFSSRSRSSSKSSGSVRKKISLGSKKQSPLDKATKPSEPLPKSIVTKVIPPSLADMSSVSNSKSASLNQQIAVPPSAPSAPSTMHGSSGTTGHGESNKPAMTSLSITIAGKPSSTSNRTNQLQPVGKAVAEAFKDADDEAEEDVRLKSRMSRLPQTDFGKSNEVATASGVMYKSGIVQGNITYPIPLKATHSSEVPKKNLAPTSDKQAHRAATGSSSSSRSSSSHSNNSRSSSSHSGDSEHIYSDIASPISSDSSISPTKARQAPADRSHAMPQRLPDHNASRMLNAMEKERRSIKVNKHFDAKPERRDFRDGRAPLGEPVKMARKEHRPDYRTDMRQDPKMAPRRPNQMPKNEMMHQDMKEVRGGDGREHYRTEARKVDQRMDPKSSNLRPDHLRERMRTTMHPQQGRREERISHGRAPKDASMEYRRVVRSGPSAPKGDMHHNPAMKRPPGPHPQRSPKRMRMNTDYKEPVKIPIPDKNISGRGSTRMSREALEEDVISSFQPPSKVPAPAKASTRKNTSTKREELLQQLKAVEDAIAKKRSKNP